ncbi:hypothetical protein E2562_005075 [Oryza meyeriana var. granulata]|uniref:Uncharacterized protein n=1 Tax=Oryza meyeriana var. granulata TaxID=110450 RepID=A0A6G1BT12_9ORYZ|nr:hypothetical protein E2562_005075 [Oryza meyeriana var. granulata]
MAGFLGFTLPEYAGYTLFGQPPRCSGLDGTPRLAHTYASRLTGSAFRLFPRLPSGRTDTRYLCPYRESHPALTRLVELSDAQATQLDLLLEAYRALARHNAALEHRLAEEGVTFVDTTSWDLGRLCHSLAQSFYSSHGFADTPSGTCTPSSRVPYSPYFSSRPRHHSPPYTPGYSPVPAYLPRAPIGVSSTNEPTTDAGQSEELQ